MDILVSDSLKDRVSIETLEKQMSSNDLSDDTEKTRVLKIKRKNDEIILTLECDSQLLNRFYDFSIGLVKEITITSRDLNLKTENIISYSVVGCSINYETSIKKIKITLKTE